MIDLARVSRASRPATESREGSRNCSRPDCAATATAGLSFRYATRGVFLDLLAAESASDAYALCTPHADRIRPPVGWDLVDRRPAPPPIAPDPGDAGLALGYAPDQSASAEGATDGAPLVAVLADALRTHREVSLKGEGAEPPDPPVLDAWSGVEVFPAAPDDAPTEPRLEPIEVPQATSGTTREERSDAIQEPTRTRDAVPLSPGVIRARFW